MNIISSNTKQQNLLQKKIFAGKNTLDNTDKYQRGLLNDFLDFSERTKPRDREKKLKRDTIESLNALYKCREVVLNAFKSEMFPLKLKVQVNQVCQLTKLRYLTIQVLKN